MIQEEVVEQIKQLLQRNEFGKRVSEHLLQNQGLIKPLVNHMWMAVAKEIESAESRRPPKVTGANQESDGRAILIPNGGPSEYSDISSEDEPNNRRDLKTHYQKNVRLGRTKPRRDQDIKQVNSCITKTRAAARTV